MVLRAGPCRLEGLEVEGPSVCEMLAVELKRIFEKLAARRVARENRIEYSFSCVRGEGFIGPRDASVYVDATRDIVAGPYSADILEALARLLDAEGELSAREYAESLAWREAVDVDMLAERMCRGEAP